MELIFKFNDTDIGNIEKYIEERFYNNKNELCKLRLSIQRNLIINIYKFKNKLPLIINNFKEHFNISKIYYNIVTIDNIKYYAYRNNNNIPLQEYLLTNDIKYKLPYYQIRNNLAFNWLMCLNLNYEKNLYVFANNSDPFITDMKTTKNIIVKFINEKSFKTNTDNHVISKSILDKYFNGSEEEFRDVVKDLVDEVDPDIFRSKVKEIIEEIDPQFLTWLNSVYKNIVFAKQFNYSG